MVEIENYTDIISVLERLANGPGAALLVGWLWSLLVEYVPLWHRIKPGIKVVAGGVLSVAIALGAMWLLHKSNSEVFMISWETMGDIVKNTLAVWLGAHGSYVLGLTKRKPITPVTKKE